jgi:hypothetical protein
MSRVRAVVLTLTTETSGWSVSLPLSYTPQPRTVSAGTTWEVGEFDLDLNIKRAEKPIQNLDIDPN